MNDDLLEQRLRAMATQIEVPSSTISLDVQRAARRRRRRRSAYVIAAMLTAIVAATVLVLPRRSPEVTTAAGPPDRAPSSPTAGTSPAGTVPPEVLRVERLPPANGGPSCWRISVASGTATHCNPPPGASLFKVGQQYYVVGTNFTQAGSGHFTPDPVSGIAAASYDRWSSLSPSGLDACLLPGIADAVEAYTQAPAAIWVLSCGADFALIMSLPLQPIRDTTTLAMALRGGRWEVRGSIESLDPNVCAGLSRRCIEVMDQVRSHQPS